MKQKMRLLDRIFMTGIWISPLVLYGLYKYMVLTRPYDPITSYPWPIMVLVSLLPPMYVFSGNLIAAASGQDTFGPQDTNVDRPNAFRSATGKERAMYPDEFPSVLLHKEPAGIVLGKRLGKRKTVYLCKPPGDKAGSHVLIIGNSGSGKSSCQIIPTLLAKGNTKVLCIDIKGELSENSEKLDSVIRIDPQNRDSWGWDPLYELQETSSEQEILQCMQGIAYSLIPLPADVKEPFWKVNARNLLTGLLIGYYKAGLKDFISLVDAILETPAKDSITALIDKAKPGAVEKKYLGSFDGLADDTLSGVVSEYTQSLMVFLDADVRYMMQVNRRRAHPGMLVDLSKSVYICIKEYMLEPYYNLLQLMLSQCLLALQKQENVTAEPCMVIIDELPRLCSQGKIEHLLDGMRTLRSKNGATRCGLKTLATGF